MAPILLYKKLGETPLGCLERFRVEHSEYKDVPMTYVGRLDPMAEGLLLALAGEECKQKEKYLGLDKEYEAEILWGVETDTYDILGKVREGKNEIIKEQNIKIVLEEFVQKRMQAYPPYSSKTVNGKQLFELARENDLPQEMPEREVEIFSIKIGNSKIIKNTELLEEIVRKINLVKGDFRQKEIERDWKKLLEGKLLEFMITPITVSCSSGTYIRSLAHEAGKKLGIGAIAFSIKRTKVGRYTLS
jgi:tRNA pseudouridine55 synthase